MKEPYIKINYSGKYAESEYIEVFSKEEKVGILFYTVKCKYKFLYLRDGLRKKYGFYMKSKTRDDAINECLSLVRGMI